MRIYIVQYKLVSDGMPCVPYSFDTSIKANDKARKLAALYSVYTGVRVCSIRLPDYTLQMCSVEIEIERTFDPADIC